ncbi:MAG: sterol desaturase family protein [Rhizobiaceae bacterium]|nr:sterol desaturase family protein [Rhizobiaceae bacterium]
MEAVLEAVLAAFGDYSFRLMPLYLVATLAIALCIFMFRYGFSALPGFLRWIAPTEIYAHPSHMVDIKLLLFSQALTVLGLFNTVVIRTATIVLTMTVVGGLAGLELHDYRWSWLQIAFATLLLALVMDFCTYWVHRVHHEYPVLWPFHSVHHSAEVMTPVTVYRKHPVYDLISDAATAVVTGVITGLILLAFSRNINIAGIGGANVVFVIFNVLGSNFRHSHVWISYGRALEHIFISPAQHQIHHSRAVVHHDKNYGEVFAFWDWMFGTLYIPEGREDIEFGLADRDGIPIPQAHVSLGSALLVPVQESWAALSGRWRRVPEDTPETAER